MKRYIRELISQIKVEVVLEESLSRPINSSIKPVQPYFPDDSYIDEQALADYDAFIAESIEEIEDVGLEIKQSNKSNKSLTSRYFTLVDLDQDVNKTLRYMIFLKISDHVYDNIDDDMLAQINKDVKQHRNDLKKKYSQEQGHLVKWKVRQIIVNDKIFQSYDDALEEVIRLATEWSDILKRNPYKGN